jgi:hypothetical protein
MIMKKDCYTKTDLANLPDLKNKYKLLKIQIRSLETKLTKAERDATTIEGIIYDLENITEFYNGVAISIRNDFGHIICVNALPENQRHAEIYHNAHVAENIDNYGIHIYDTDDNSKICRLGSAWLGCDHTKQEVIDLAKDWVVNAKVDERFL